MFWVETAMARSFMPVAGTEIAENVDALYGFLLWASFISCVLVIGGMVLFAFKYKRRTDSDKTPYISHNVFLEFLWSFIPFVIFMVVFAWGWWIFHDMRTIPENAFEVNVAGQKWYWDFEYKSGRKSTGEAFVPVNTPVKFIMRTRDVLHSFYIPGFRIKQDVVPGRYTSLWFEATKVGTYQVFCTEYCGDGHSAMLAKVNVLPQDEFEEWLQNDPYKGLSLVEIGEQVFAGKCIACHNVTNVKKVGPGFAGLFGSERKFADGTTAVADENYIRTSILNPNLQVVEGYAVSEMDGKPMGAMPSSQGQVSEQELSGVIEYIKGLK